MSRDEYNLNICTECGKVFSTEGRPGWGWKNVKGEKVCSYTCQRKSETRPKKAARIYNRVAVRIVETGEIFKSITECAARLNTTATALRHSIYEGKDYRGYHIERVMQNEILR